MDESTRSGLIDVVISVPFKAGEQIVQQGDEGHTFYIIKSGSVSCTDDISNSAPLTLLAGQYFGELALINNKPRARTVTARENTELLALERADFQNILGSVQHALQREAGYRVLKTCEIFPGHLSASEKERICEAFKLREFKKGENIVLAGK
jgi:cAMP-dependent protein kinase regulator